MDANKVATAFETVFCISCLLFHESITRAEEGPDPFTIGGAVYGECLDPLGTGLEGLLITVQCEGGFFARVSTSHLGIWEVDVFPGGMCLVCPQATCWDFEHITGRCATDAQECVFIEVSADRQEANQRIQFLGRRLADFDRDIDVDLLDFEALFACLTGPDEPTHEHDCSKADLDGDDRTDLQDFACFQRTFTGPK